MQRYAIFFQLVPPKDGTFEGEDPITEQHKISPLEEIKMTRI